MMQDFQEGGVPSGGGRKKLQLPRRSFLKLGAVGVPLAVGLGQVLDALGAGPRVVSAQESTPQTKAEYEAMLERRFAVLYTTVNIKGQMREGYSIRFDEEGKRAVTGAEKWRPTDQTIADLIELKLKKKGGGFLEDDVEIDDGPIKEEVWRNHGPESKMPNQKTDSLFVEEIDASGRVVRIMSQAWTSAGVVEQIRIQVSKDATLAAAAGATKAGREPVVAKPAGLPEAGASPVPDTGVVQQAAETVVPATGGEIAGGEKNEGGGWVVPALAVGGTLATAVGAGIAIKEAMKKPGEAGGNPLGAARGREKAGWKPKEDTTLTYYDKGKKGMG